MSNEISMWIRIERDPATVWQAIVVPGELERWLGVEVALEPREGGRLRLRSGTPLISGEHLVRHVEPGRRIAFEWTILGHPTMVGWTLEPADGGTKLVLTASWPAGASFEFDPVFTSTADLFRELWSYVIGLLKSYLELGEAKCRLDPERAPSSTITHSITIAASPERVFAAIDDPAELPKWNAFVAEARNDRRVGGRYSYGWQSEEKGTDGPGELVEYEAGKTIAFTWHGDPPTLVRWTVEPLPGASDATRLTLTHSGFGVDRNMLVGWNLGWTGFLVGLALYLERGTPPNWFGE